MSSLDNPANLASATVSLCNNSNALVAGCTGYQGPFAAGQFYTQPAVSCGSVSVSANTLYAVPFYSPASGGPISKLALSVTATGSATACRVGVYNAYNGSTANGGAPKTLLEDGGTISVTSTITTPATLTTPVGLAPQTLYFLAVGCNGPVTLAGAVNNSGALSSPLIGAPSYVSTTTQITAATWTFGALPASFGAITNTPGSIPNVYAEP